MKNIANPVLALFVREIVKGVAPNVLSVKDIQEELKQYGFNVPDVRRIERILEGFNFYPCGIMFLDKDTVYYEKKKDYWVA